MKHCSINLIIAFFGATLPISTFAAAQTAGPVESESTPKARQTMHAFAACAADNSTEKALKTLQMDFRTTAYRSALRTLAIDNRQCLAGGKMQSAGILFAAGMAERLLETRFAPARDTLVRAADSVAPEPRNASDALAICVVRTAPADVAGLFESDVAGEQEMAMAKALTPTVNRCAGSGLSPVMSTSGLRAILATAALRVVAAGAEQAG